MPVAKYYNDLIFWKIYDIYEIFMTDGEAADMSLFFILWLYSNCCMIFMYNFSSQLVFVSHTHIACIQAEWNLLCVDWLPIHRLLHRRIELCACVSAFEGRPEISCFRPFLDSIYVFYGAERSINYLSWFHSLSHFIPVHFLIGSAYCLLTRRNSFCWPFFTTTIPFVFAKPVGHCCCSCWCLIRDMQL